MRIAFDAKRAAQNRTGLGNYSRFVIRILQRYYPDDMQLLYVPNPRKTQYLGSDLTSSGRVSLRFPQGFWKRLRSLWRVWGVTADTKREGCDVFHGLSNELPLNVRKAGCRKVVTIHDLIFVHCPEYLAYHSRATSSKELRAASAAASLACRRASLGSICSRNSFLASSRFSRASRRLTDGYSPREISFCLPAKRYASRHDFLPVGVT